MRRDDQCHRATLDVDVGIEDVACDRRRLARRVARVVCNRDRGDDARENLADQNLVDGRDDFVSVHPPESLCLVASARLRHQRSSRQRDAFQ